MAELISKVSLFLEPLPTNPFGEARFLSLNIEVLPPETLIEKADEALRLDGELLSYVRRNPSLPTQKIRRMAESEKKTFFDLTSESTQWATYFASTESGIQYDVLVEFDVVALALRNLQKNTGLDAEAIESLSRANFELQKNKKRLQNRWLLVGRWARRRTCKRLAAEASPEAVPLLAEALSNPDPEVRTMAGEALRSLPGRDARDALCRIAIEEPNSMAAKLCVNAGVRPSNSEEACLFLFVTRQMHAYFEEDFDFQNLRAAYDRASEKVRGYVMDAVRSGDRLLLGFFGGRKPLRECNDQEIKLAIESALRHRDWFRLFRAFQELPLKYGLPLLEHFRDSGWEPPEAEMKSLLRQALAQSQGLALSLPRKDLGSTVFERWLSARNAPAGARQNLWRDLSPPPRRTECGSWAPSRPCRSVRLPP